MCWRHCGHWSNWLVNSDKQNIKMIVVIIVITSLILKYSSHNANKILDFWTYFELLQQMNNYFYSPQDCFPYFHLLFGINWWLCCGGGSTPLLDYFCLQQFNILCSENKKLLGFRLFWVLVLFRLMNFLLINVCLEWMRGVS